MNYFSTTLNQSLKHYAFFASFFWLKFTFSLPNKNGLNCEIDIIIFVQMTKTRENRHTHNSLPDASSINTALTTGSQVMGFWIQKVLLFSPGIVWFRFSTRNYGFSFVGFRSFNVTDICHHHVAAVVMMWVLTSDGSGSGFEFFFSGFEIFSRYWFYLKFIRCTIVQILEQYAVRFFY